jgi:hypothetical protein
MIRDAFKDADRIEGEPYTDVGSMKEIHKPESPRGNRRAALIMSNGYWRLTFFAPRIA